MSAGSDATFTMGKYFTDANFSDAGIPGTSLESSFLNGDAMLLKGQFDPSSSLFDGDSCEEPKPLTDAGQWLDSSAWKSMPDAFNMHDFPGL